MSGLAWRSTASMISAYICLTKAGLAVLFVNVGQVQPADFQLENPAWSEEVFIQATRKGW